MTTQVTLDGNTAASALDGTETSSCIQGIDKTFTFNQVKTFVNSGNGTAASKNATDNTKPNVASTSGSFVVGNFIKAADTSGTSQDSGSAPSALSRVNDTNVTLTLGGAPTTALLQAASLTLGWTGQLSASRGGTGVDNGGNTLTFGGTLNFANAFATVGAFGVTQTYTGLTNVTFPTTGTLATTSQLPTPAALTKVDDTNVTLSLSGTPATALLQATALTLGWTGQLSGARGGTGVNNGSNTITVGGNLSTANSFTTSGNFPVTQTYTGSTNVTFPTSGTLATTSQVPSGTPSPLTKIDDTNVTMTLGGTPATALLQGVSLTLGWAGLLGGNRGGTGANNGSNTATYAGNLSFANAFTTSGNFPVTQTYTGTTSVTFPTAGTLATTSQIPAGAALTKTDDTNVTLTLGGSASTSLVNAASLTLGWTGQLSSARGGTGVNNGSNTITVGGNLSTANSFTTSGNFPVTHTYTGTTNVTFPTSGTLATTSGVPTGVALTKTDDTNVTLTLGGSPTTALVNAASLTLGWAGQLAVTRGGTGFGSTTAYGLIAGGTTSTGALQNVGTGNTGTILVGNGSGLLPTFNAPTTLTSAGSIQLIQNQTVVGSSTTNVDFTSASIVNYNCIKVVYRVASLSGSNTFFRVQISNDGGLTYLATGYLSGVTSNAYNTATLGNTNATTHFLLSGGFTSTSTDVGMGELFIFGSFASPTLLLGETVLLNSDVPFRVSPTGRIVSSFNALRFSFVSGNFRAGSSITVYGVAIF